MCLQPCPGRRARNGESGTEDRARVPQSGPICGAVTLMKGGEEMPRAKKTAEEPKKKRTGASPKYATAEELQEKIDAYFAECEANGDVPEEFGLGVYLGVSLMTLDNWYNGRRCEYLQDTIQMAYMRMSAAAVQMAYRNPKAPMPIFALKQKRYGGYQDKVEANAEVKVSVQMGKNMEASDFA